MEPVRSSKMTISADTRVGECIAVHSAAPAMITRPDMFCEPPYRFGRRWTRNLPFNLLLASIRYMPFSQVLGEHCATFSSLVTAVTILVLSVLVLQRLSTYEASLEPCIVHTADVDAKDRPNGRSNKCSSFGAFPEAISVLFENDARLNSHSTGGFML